MSRVFVIHEPRRADGSPQVNLRPAAIFGDVTVVLGQGKPHPDPMVSLPSIRAALAEYRPEDYIVLLGEMDLVALATWVALERCGSVRFLKWDRQNGAYFPVVANLEENREDERRATADR